ncbi:MAG: SPOR domain-containing protein [Rhodospirillaceae bacterium]|nr:SPOR domain-containing protein [Rhodospirillaceae bacterium]
MAIDRDGDGPPLKRASSKPEGEAASSGKPFTDNVFDDDYYSRRGRSAERGTPFGLIVGVVFGAAVAGGIAWYVISTPESGSSGPPPVIAADPEPYKLKPKDPGGLQVADQDKLVYERVGQTARPPQVENLMPPPEQVNPPPPQPSAPPAPATALPPAAVPAAAPVAAADDVTSIVDEMRKQMEANEAAAAAVVAASTASTETPPAAPEAPQQAAAVPTTEAPMGAAVAATAPGAFLVQLAAARSEDAAMSEWTRLSGKHKDLLGALSPTVERADLGERGVFFRLKAGPLADRAQADTLCAAIKAQNEACLVVKP